MDDADPTSQSMRSGRAVNSGETPKTIRNLTWIHPMHGIVRRADAGLDPVMARLSDAVALMGTGNVLGGWASLRAQGNTWFDLDRRGDIRPVMIHCLGGSQLRKRPGIVPCRGLLFADEFSRLEKFDVTSLARAAYDEMRLARGLREAVVVVDMAVSTTSYVPHTSLAAINRVIESHHKTRGIEQARRALVLGSSRSASPWETRTRLIARLDAGLEGLLVNAPVFDRTGDLLGIADLLDPHTGLVIESDGAGHREADAHSSDNIREEKFERARMTVVRVSAVEHADRNAVAARIGAAQRDAKKTDNDRWTLDTPDWWSRWPHARRWA